MNAKNGLVIFIGSLRATGVRGKWRGGGWVLAYSKSLSLLMESLLTLLRLRFSVSISTCANSDQTCGNSNGWDFVQFRYIALCRFSKVPLIYDIIMYCPVSEIFFGLSCVKSSIWYCVHPIWIVVGFQ